jgi:hypothetical protein
MFCRLQNIHRAVLVASLVRGTDSPLLELLPFSRLIVPLYDYRLEKRRFSLQDKKKRYGKADAYHSAFMPYWMKRLLLKRILSYDAPPLPGFRYSVGVVE